MKRAGKKCLHELVSILVIKRCKNTHLPSKTYKIKKKVENNDNNHGHQKYKQLKYEQKTIKLIILDNICTNSIKYCRITFKQSLAYLVRTVLGTKVSY